MKGRRHSIIIIMMTSSVILLLVLQFIWLRLAYNGAKENFQRKTGVLFRSTVLGLYDVLIEKNITMIEGDTLNLQTTRKIFDFRGSAAPMKPINPDRISDYLHNQKQTTDANLFIIGARKDTISHILKPQKRRIVIRDYRHDDTLVIRLDSLQVDSIIHNVTKGLRDIFSSNYADLTFAVSTIDAGGCCPPKMFGAPNKRFNSEVVMLNPDRGYMITFSGTEKLLLKEIAPQIVFSVILTFLTVAAFYIMYRSLRTQEHLMTIKNDFISNVTHELKTPVATVSVALEALKNFNALNDAHRTQEYLEIAQQELNRLTLMTDKILKAAVFEDNGVTLRIEKIDLDILIEQVLSSLKVIVERRAIQLTYRKEGEDFSLEGSQTHLTNVIYNLVDNAIKYSNDGSAITIILGSTAQHVKLSIVDSGIGIPKEFQKKIFEKFFRVPTGDIHNIKGYGLGLSFVASVIKSHHGSIGVESEPGKGSTFTVLLPKAYEN